MPGDPKAKIRQQAAERAAGAAAGAVGRDKIAAPASAAAAAAANRPDAAEAAAAAASAAAPDVAAPAMAVKDLAPESAVPDAGLPAAPVPGGLPAAALPGDIGPGDIAAPGMPAPAPSTPAVGSPVLDASTPASPRTEAPGAGAAPGAEVDATPGAAPGTAPGAEAPSASPTAGTAPSDGAAPGAAADVATRADRSRSLLTDVVDDLVDAVGLGGKTLDTPAFRFSDIDGPCVDWRVRRFRFSEGLSQPYELSVEIQTRDLEADTDMLLGARVCFEIERGDLLRTAYGIVRRIEYIGVVEDAQFLRAYVVPAFALLSQQIDTRIFQGMTAVEIVCDVLKSALAPYERDIDHESRLKGTYNKRDYCVQYRESDRDFVCRLLEEEGIAYCFVPDDEGQRERLVLCDNNNDYVEVPTSDGEAIPFMAALDELGETESLSSFEWNQSEQINSVATRGFNWKVSTAPDEHLALRDDPHHNRDRELYLHGDRRQIVDDKEDPAFTGASMRQRETAAERHMELHASQTERGWGGSNVTGFVPGLRFRVLEHFRADIEDATFLLLRVLHTGEAPEEVRGDAATEVRYTNRFECMPDVHAYRPPVVTPSPRAHGPETATVVGPDTEEIHTDKYGRIKIQFHWDRINPADDPASCWVRCAQTWAGAGWGSLFIPRIGMEVVVEFLEGNPDRPLVTGCVYNDKNPLPYTLPDDKTKSTIKTNSSIGGGGFNELRLEDRKGAEEVFIHAQKDFNEVVEHDHSTKVHHDQSNAVDGNQTNTVGGNQTESVTGKQTVSVDKNRSVAVKGSQSVTIKGAGANDGVCGGKLHITGDYKVDATQSIEIQAPKHIKFTVGKSSVLIEPGKISIVSGGKAQVIFDADAVMTSSVGSEVRLDASATTAASNEGAQVKLTANAVVQAKDGGTVTLDKNAKMTGKEVIVGSTDGGTVKLTANADVGGGDVSVSGGKKVGIAAPAVSCAASGTNEISGGVVRIN